MTPAAPAPVKARRKPSVIKISLVAVLLVAPFAALLLSPYHGALGLVVLAMLPALTAASSGPKAMGEAGVVVALTGFLAVLITATDAVALLGTLLVVVLAFVTGAVSRAGFSPVGAATIAFAAYLMIDTSRVQAALGTGLTVLQTAGIVFACVVVLCGWVLLVWLVFVRGAARMEKPKRAPVTLPYGLLLALLCGVFTLVCLIWFRGTNAWWTVLTVSLVLEPTVEDTRKRLDNRIVGTVLGGVIAALVVVLTPGGAVPGSLGIIALAALIVLSATRRPYWMCVTATTVSVILATFQAGTMIGGTLERIGLTLLAAAVTAGAVWVAARFIPDSQFTGDDAVPLDAALAR